MEEHAKHTDDWAIDPLDVDNAVRVILRALEKKGLRIVEAEGQ